MFVNFLRFTQFTKHLTPMPKLHSPNSNVNNRLYTAVYSLHLPKVNDRYEIYSAHHIGLG